VPYRCLLFESKCTNACENSADKPICITATNVLCSLRNLHRRHVLAAGAGWKPGCIHCYALALLPLPCIPVLQAIAVCHAHWLILCGTSTAELAVDSTAGCKGCRGSRWLILAWSKGTTVLLPSSSKQRSRARCQQVLPFSIGRWQSVLPACPLLMPLPQEVPETALMRPLITRVSSDWQMF
jgi:hypothetical protein